MQQSPPSLRTWLQLTRMVSDIRDTAVAAGVKAAIRGPLRAELLARGFVSAEYAVEEAPPSSNLAPALAAAPAPAPAAAPAPAPAPAPASADVANMNAADLRAIDMMAAGGGHVDHAAHLAQISPGCCRACGDPLGTHQWCPVPSSSPLSLNYLEMGRAYCQALEDD